jgi:hypothetical protein
MTLNKNFFKNKAIKTLIGENENEMGRTGLKLLWDLKIRHMSELPIYKHRVKQSTTEHYS